VEVTTLWRFTDMIMIIIFLLWLYVCCSHQEFSAAVRSTAGVGSLGRNRGVWYDRITRGTAFIMHISELCTI